jgi:hypothetical protein
MAGAIAHNFNNMLGAVIGNLDLALDDVPAGAEPRQLITEAMEASKRAAAISRLMRAYVGQSVGSVEPIGCLHGCFQCHTRRLLLRHRHFFLPMST